MNILASMENTPKGNAISIKVPIVSYSEGISTRI